MTILLMSWLLRLPRKKTPNKEVPLVLKLLEPLTKKKLSSLELYPKTKRPNSEF